MRQPVVHPLVLRRVKLGFVEADDDQRDEEQEEHYDAVELRLSDSRRSRRSVSMCRGPSGRLLPAMARGSH